MVDLNPLHDIINAIAPIYGISATGNGTYRIDWVEPATPEQQNAALSAIAQWTATASQNWKGLLNDLQGSALFARAYAAANESLPALNAFNLINLALTATNRTDNLVFGFAQLRSAMPSTTAGDFTENELEWLGDRLVANGFDIALLDTPA